MPSKPACYVTTALDLIDKSSPLKAEAFERAGMTSTRHLDQAVVGVVTSCLTSPKESTTRENLACSLSVLKNTNCSDVHHKV